MCRLVIVMSVSKRNLYMGRAIICEIFLGVSAMQATRFECHGLDEVRG